MFKINFKSDSMSKIFCWCEVDEEIEGTNWFGPHSTTTDSKMRSNCDGPDTGCWLKTSLLATFTDAAPRNRLFLLLALGFLVSGFVGSFDEEMTVAGPPPGMVASSVDDNTANILNAHGRIARPSSSSKGNTISKSHKLFLVTATANRNVIIIFWKLGLSDASLNDTGEVMEIVGVTTANWGEDMYGTTIAVKASRLLPTMEFLSNEGTSNRWFCKEKSVVVAAEGELPEGRISTAWCALKVTPNTYSSQWPTGMLNFSRDASFRKISTTPTSRSTFRVMTWPLLNLSIFNGNVANEDASWINL